MIVEVLIDGITKYRWPVNENDGIIGGFSWKTRVEFRENAVKRVLAKVKEEIIPNLKEQGLLEIHLIFESKFPDEDEVEETDVPENKLRPIRLFTPPDDEKKPSIKKAPFGGPVRPDPETKSISRPKAVYSNPQYASF